MIPSNRLNRYLKFINYEHNTSSLYRPSEITGYELIPHSTLSVNSYGMFDKEYPLKKDKNVFRILVLGDSITAPNLYPEMLEERLNALELRGLKFEVWNAGLPGIGVRQYISYLMKKGIYFYPDMIFIGFCISDFEVWTPIVYKSKNNLLEYYNPFPRMSRYLMNRFLFRRSHLYRFLMIRLENLLYSKYRKTEGSLYDKKEEGAYCLKLIKKVCLDRKITLLATIFPYLKPLDTYTEDELKEYQNMIDALKELEINYLDLYTYFKDFNLYSLRESKDDFVHPNVDGHKIVAEVIYDYLIANYFKN